MDRSAYKSATNTKKIAKSCFTKKVQFDETNHSLPQRLKSTFFEKKFNGTAPKGPAE